MRGKRKKGKRKQEEGKKWEREKAEERAEGKRERGRSKENQIESVPYRQSKLGEIVWFFIVINCMISLVF